jgi:hypothetical protein
VERFSNRETGQSATVDAPLAMALVAQTAAATTPHARAVLGVGCGAGNYSLNLLEVLPNLDATLIDLSQPMLDRTRQRVSRATAGLFRHFSASAHLRELLPGFEPSQHFLPQIGELGGRLSRRPPFAFRHLPLSFPSGCVLLPSLSPRQRISSTHCGTSFLGLLTRVLTG